SVVVLTGHATEVDAQGALDKKVEVSGKRTTVKELIAALEEQSGAHFIYSSSAIKTHRKIKLASLDGDLSEVLNLVFRPIGIGYVVEQDKILLFSTIQEFTITGKITDASTGAPILGAAVKVRGTTRGTSTD